MSLSILRSWRTRLRAGAIHLCISAAVAAVAALFVFVFWYPDPFREISGGRELFVILISVDIVLGPLITVAVFNRTKPWPTLRRDLAFIGLFQLAALGYGMWTTFVARPVYVVFEYDRFRVVHAIEVPKELLAQAPPGLQSLPVFGTSELALRPFFDEEEKFRKTMMALEGLSLGAQPELWIPYKYARDRVIKAAKPVSALRQRFPDQAAAIDRALEKAGRSADNVVYLPLVGRKSFWTALLDASTTEIVAYLPLDSF